jgi:hypothetical protein
MPKTGDKNASSLSTVQRHNIIEPRMCTAMPRPLHLLSSRRGPHTEHPAELLEPETQRATLASFLRQPIGPDLQLSRPNPLASANGSPNEAPRAAPSVMLSPQPCQSPNPAGCGANSPSPRHLSMAARRLNPTGRRANALAASIPSDRPSGYPGGTHPLLFAAAVAPFTQPRGSRSQTHQQPPTAVFVNQSAQPIGSPNNNASASHRLKLAR